MATDNNSQQPQQNIVSTFPPPPPFYTLYKVYARLDIHLPAREEKKQSNLRSLFINYKLSRISNAAFGIDIIIEETYLQPSVIQEIFRNR